MTNTNRRARDIGLFMRAHLPVRSVAGVADIMLHQAGPRSGLSRIAGHAPPYWAHVWGGGLALARHILGHEAAVRGRRVLDLGTGSGLVGIAAAKAGARHVLASDSDPDALAAMSVNAALNGVAVDPLPGDLLDGPPPDVDLVAGGDVFFDAGLAARVTAFLERCTRAGIDVLIGDPWRGPLPREKLRLLADYDVRDFGDAGAGRAGVFAFIGAGSP